MKVIITGGSGFIGSHVVNELVVQNHEVIIYDIDTPRFGQRCEFIRGDVRDIDRLVAFAKGANAIYHLAAEANVNRFYESPLFSSEITALGTLCVLEAARRTDIERVLLASTEWIYGSVEEAGSSQITEDTPYAQKPDHLYTSSKIAAELFCINYKRLYDVNYTIMRYGIPFGERARPETVTPIFIKKILNNEEVSVHGDGSQTRQFIYVKDLALGNVACLKQQAENQIINLNGKERISVQHIIQTIEKIIGRKAIVTFVEDRKGNFKGRFISSKKALRLLGWEPLVEYEEAMSHYVDWFLKCEQQ